MEENGKGHAEVVFEQLIDKHPQHEESWEPPVRSTDKSDDPTVLPLRAVTLAVDPKVCVDPRGFRSY